MNCGCCPIAGVGNLGTPSVLNYTIHRTSTSGCHALAGWNLAVPPGSCSSTTAGFPVAYNILHIDQLLLLQCAATHNTILFSSDHIMEPMYIVTFYQSLGRTETPL